MLTMSYFLATTVDILSIWVLFDRFHMVKGWTLEEVGLIYGIMHTGFSIAESWGRGFDTFWESVKSGDFDRNLLRPISTLIQVAAQDVLLIRLGRLFQGVIVLFWSASALGIDFISTQSLLIFVSIIGTAALFYGLTIIQGAISFWTIETLEIVNITTYGGLESGQYPMSIYKWPFRLIFTFVIPIACVAYYPMAVSLHHESFPLWSAFLLPLSGLVFFYLACQFWHLGVRHYHSTGS
jgi:ABC-2 type transport system permease protein